MRRLKILTWHTRGSYLYHLSQAPHDFHVLSKPGRPPGYGGPHPPGAHMATTQDMQGAQDMHRPQRERAGQAGLRGKGARRRAILPTTQEAVAAVSTVRPLRDTSWPLT